MRTWLITGADRGIGHALCVAAGMRGKRVFAACLGDGTALRGTHGIEVVPDIDVTRDAAMARLRAALGELPLDVLVHNAGVVHERTFGRFDFDAMQHEYAVNALGPLRVTEALAGNLQAGSKVALITSRVGSLGENASGGLYGYRMSKAAANMAGICLAHELRPRGIAVICLHPGSVLTEMTRGLTDQQTVGILIEPAAAAEALLDRIDELTLATSGTFRHANGQSLPW
jgi:NAD(P)-dependent dehydrogenase (short-subunit alcohol dehydrogenase family)